MTHLPRFHRSKVDLWLALVLAAGVLLAGFGALVAALAPDWTARLAAVPVLLLGVGLPLWIVWGTSYQLDPEALRVRCGPLRWTVPVHEITRVRPTRNPLSSPALSLDRLRIEYGDRRALMISPRDRERFLRELEMLRPEVEIQRG